MALADGVAPRRLNADGTFRPRPESGGVTFAVPVVGDEPQIQVDASLSTNVDGMLHYYSGSLVVAGCARGETAACEPTMLALDHSRLSGLGDFIASLGHALKTPGTNPSDPTSAARNDPLAPGGGGRRLTPRAPAESRSEWLGLALGLGAALPRRRHKA